MKAVILAGGKGTRLRPFTSVLPKPLMPIGDYPILEILIRQLKHYGITEIIIAVGYLAPLIETYCKNGERWGVSITYSHELEPLGTAGPLSLLGEVDETLLVLNGDLLTDLNFNHMVQFHKQQQATVTVGMFERPVEMSLGILKTDANNNITDYIEKPTIQYDVSMGIYLLEPSVMELLPHSEYCDFPDLILKLVKTEEKVIGYKGASTWLDIGRPDDYQLAIDQFDQLKDLFWFEN